MLHCIVGYIGDTRLPGLVNPFLFCKERVIPSCAANSCFACFVKTEQRKSLCVCNAILRAQCCHSFDVYLNSSMSRRSFEGLTDNHWKKIFVGEKTNKKGALEFCTRGEGERRGSFEPVACQSFFCVFMWGDEWEFPVPPPCYLSPESGQTRCTGWRKVEFVDFERGETEKKNLPRFWTFTTATYTSAIPQQSVHGNKNIKWNNLGL